MTARSNQLFKIRKWWILATTFYLNLVVDGYCCVFGILAIHIQQDYPVVHPALIATIGALSPTLYNLLAPVGLAMVEYCGCRDVTIGGALASTAGFILCWLNGTFFNASFWLDFVALGFVEGLAFAMLYGPSINIIPTFFDHKTKSLAIGITTCGSAVGAILFGFIIDYLIVLLGWRGSMLIFAAFSLNGVVMALSFPSHASLERAGIRDELFPGKGPSQRLSMKNVFSNYFDFSFFSKPIFLLVLTAGAFSTAGFLTPLFLIPSHTMVPEFGVSAVVSSKIIFFWGCANLLGRLVSGRLGDYGRNHENLTILSSYWILIIGLSVCSISLLVFPAIMQFGDHAFVAISVIFGFFIAPLITMRSVLVIDLFGVHHASTCFGWFLATQGVCQVFGYALPAFLNTLSTEWAYLFSAICLAASALCIAATGRVFFKQRSHLFNELRSPS